tara:strand:- start:7436 stop:7651 length:216 start_codon:yes stop_codon:yes gene_type:complete
MSSFQTIDKLKLDSMNKLKDARLRLGVTQEEMAHLLGYTDKNTVHLIEKGERKMSGVAVKCLGYLLKLNKK